jgi:putative nucleotidyltransferase with HDIG domain
LSLIALTIAYLLRERPDIATSPKDLLLISLIFVGTAGVCRFLSTLSPYVVPIATSSILITVLLEGRLAMLITTFMAIYVGVLIQSLPATCVGMIAGFAGILALSKADHRSHLIASTMVVGFVSTCGALTFSLISSKPWQAMLSDLSFGALSGIISAAIAVGVMPTLEYLFGITTHFRLLDISNPGEPLLQNLLKNAPGTYQHSIMVANLAESAAQSIGANALLCKVGAYYHDIGKMKRPRFFVENQMGGENPHDRLAPSLSTTIIHSHVKDGIEMARQHKLPDVVIDFIAEHHGTTLVKFFYHQARTRSSEPVYEDDFRYPGPKPQSRETAVVLLCDGIEAAARTMASPTAEKLAELVNKMVQDHLDDGQLDECDLSLKDISLIRESLIRSLHGIYHTRIEYPEPSSLRGTKKVTNLRKKA